MSASKFVQSLLCGSEGRLSRSLSGTRRVCGFERFVPCFDGVYDTGLSRVSSEGRTFRYMCRNSTYTDCSPRFASAARAFRQPSTCPSDSRIDQVLLNTLRRARLCDGFNPQYIVHPFSANVVIS